MGLFGEIKCRRCDRRYSAIRSRCPYCGARKKRGKVDRDGDGRSKLIIGIVLLAVIVIAVIVLVYMSLTGKSFGTPKATPTPTVSATATPKPSATPTPKVSATPAPGTTPGTSPVITPAPGGVTVTNITLSRTDITLQYIGETWTLYPTLTPASSTQTVKWTSSDPNIVSVSASGQVAAIANGNATITAEAGGAKASCIVRVTGTAVAPAAPDTQGASASTSSSFTLSHTDVTLSAAKKESFTLRAQGTSNTPTFRSDNANIASVATDGTVTAVSSGSTRIYVTAGGTTLECVVRVN